MRIAWLDEMSLIDRLLLVVMLCGVLGLSLGLTMAPWYFGCAAVVFIAVVLLIVRRPSFGVYVIAAALPFERLGAYELGGVTIRLSQIMLFATAVAWLIHQVMDRPARLVRNPLLLPLSIFLAVNVMSLINTPNLPRSIIVLAYITFTASLVFWIPNLITNTAQIKRLIAVMLISYVLVSAFGLFQFAGDMLGLPPEITGLRDLYTQDVLGFTRVQSTAYEPLYFANYLLLPIAIVFTFFLSQRSAMTGTVALVLFGLGMVAFILTVSRGAYIAIAGMLMVIALFYLKRVLRPRLIVSFVLVGVIVGWIVLRALGAGGGLFTLEKFQEHVINVFYGASFNERVYTFEQASLAWQEDRLLGVGVGAFGPWVAPHPAYMPDDGWKIVNNEFIEILAETGLLGLISFLSLLVLLLIRTFRAIRITRDGYLRAVLVASLAAVIGIIIQYQTFSTLYIMHVWFAIAFLVAAQNISMSDAHT
ncbi:MAG: O-antigen ligase family protein [Candidatus Kerfeldbacteria bacterium]|nr:O-antigen ligase family protein [Candidatus Kerfeldbacteria bacterium]